MNPALVMNRLAEIEREIAERQSGWEQAAEDYAVAKNVFERKEAEGFLLASGPVAEREAKALQYAKETHLELQRAEAANEIAKRAMKSYETRASIGQSLLKRMEADQYSRMPQRTAA